MYKVYRCTFDNKLFLPEDFEKHAGHKIEYGSDNTVLETVKVLYWMAKGKLQKRANYQS